MHANSCLVAEPYDCVWKDDEANVNMIKDNGFVIRQAKVTTRWYGQDHTT
jgi:hypothetical protein